MGIEIIRVGDQQSGSLSKQISLSTEFICREYSIDNPSMNISMMYVDNQLPLFPWWTYGKDLDEDVSILNQTWNISNPQSLFDCLFLYSLKKNVGRPFFAIFPGTVKNQNWDRVQASDRTVYLSGQACVYHLHGEFQKKLSVQWVPFWQPQSMVKDPDFLPLWRLFQQISAEDSVKGLTFFQLDQISKLPQVINLLNEPENHRSERLAELVDWFGMYSSSHKENSKPGFVGYTKDKSHMQIFTDIKNTFEPLFHAAQKTLTTSAAPKTALRFLSGHIAL